MEAAELVLSPSAAQAELRAAAAQAELDSAAAKRTSPTATPAVVVPAQKSADVEMPDIDDHEADAADALLGLH